MKKPFEENVRQALLQYDMLENIYQEVEEKIGEGILTLSFIEKNIDSLTRNKRALNLARYELKTSKKELVDYLVNLTNIFGEREATIFFLYYFKMLSVQEIAFQLNLAEITINNYLDSIKRKIYGKDKVSKSVPK